MKFLYLLLLIITLSYSCSLKKSNNNKNITNTNPIVIDKINLILDNSGSMVGYLKEDKFIRNLTNLIAELEWMKSKNDSTFIIKELNFYTFENNFLLKKFDGNSSRFCDLLNNKSIAVVKTSPIDEFIDSLVDSIKDSSIYIFITDLIIDKKNDNIENIIQAKFNLTFNKAYNLNLGFILYRLLSEYSGTYFPVKGTSYNVSNVERPYFILILGSMNNIKILYDKFKDFKAFIPENEIEFGIPFIPKNVEILHLSNRSGKWKFKNGEFKRVSTANEKLKFTIAINIENFPQFVQDSAFIVKNLDFISNIIKIDSFKVYDRNSFANLIHKKEIEKLNRNSHFIEINISQNIQSENNLEIRLKKKVPDWVYEYSTENDISLDNINRYKTLYLMYIIEGIFNAYREHKENDSYFSLNYKISK